MDEIGFDWIGLDLIGLDWVGLDGLGRIGSDWIGLDWIGSLRSSNPVILLEDPNMCFKSESKQNKNG